MVCRETIAFDELIDVIDRWSSNNDIKICPGQYLDLKTRLRDWYIEILKEPESYSKLNEQQKDLVRQLVAHKNHFEIDKYNKLKELLGL